MRLALAGLLAAVLALAARRGAFVPVVRALDRGSGLFAPRGSRAYASGTRVLAGLYRRVARDAASVLAERDAMVVDIGSGPGSLLGVLADASQGAHVVGIEPAREMRAISAERGHAALAGSAEDLPLADASVALAVSTLSAHHWSSPGAAFAELRRVLRPRGEARIYDVRFVGYNARDARRFAEAAGIRPDHVTHEILDERVLGLRPFSLITVRPDRPVTTVNRPQPAAGPAQTARPVPPDRPARPAGPSRSGRMPPA